MAHRPVRRAARPRGLLEWVEESTEQLFRLQSERPELVHGDISEAGLVRQGRARAILDFVSSFTDQQAVSSFAAMTRGALAPDVPGVFDL
ncbi:hypothetical protein [Leucobacter soli]|uniref:hypothetical protein n=1 Tax=Leucobacter soli TaxID=2812850 RepID=UPI0036185D97